MLNDTWVQRINISNGLTVAHLQQFHVLWGRIQQVQLTEGAADDIAWKFTASAIYLASSAYTALFAGAVATSMRSLVRDNWDLLIANSSPGL